MIAENSPSARMQVRSRGDLVAPGCCCVCGNGTREEGFLDLGVFIDYHGTVYLCMVCVTQAGETVGMYTPEEVKHFTQQIETLLAAKEQLTSELENVTEHRNSLESTLRLSFGAAGVSSGLTDAVVEESKAEQPDFPEAASGADSGESEPTEPVKIRKPRAPSATKLRNTTFE